VRINDKIFDLNIILFNFLSGCANLYYLYKEAIKARKEGNIGVTKAYSVDTTQAWNTTEVV